MPENENDQDVEMIRVVAFTWNMVFAARGVNWNSLMN